MKYTSQEPGGKDKRPLKKRIVALKVVTILIPFLALFLLEMALRVFHYGYDPSLFIEYPQDPRYLVLNPDASKRYFPDPSLAPSGNSEPFKKKKDKNTCRIFILGESTTIGYPYFHNGSFHRWLQYRLMRTFPDRNFEIINLSLTAVSSYTVSGFGKELVNYEPDAILIYSGQNEYYGAMGVGSANSLSGNPAMIRLTLQLRQLRFGQLFSSLYKRITGAFSKNHANDGGTLMQQMAGDQRIPFRSTVYFKGIEQFRSNIEPLLHLFNEDHIPVFISNLVSNEKGLQPFVSIEADSLLYPGFKKNYELGMAAMKSDQGQMAFDFFAKADRIYPGHALCNYYLGQLSYEQGDYQESERWFSKARDLDGLRFRAPSQLNEVIVQLCEKYPNAHLVDTKAEFESCSDHHIIGSELILEHVHPNLKGYALMSDAFYKAIKKEGIVAMGKAEELSLEQLEAEMPITLVDSLAGGYKIARLKMSWPFRDGARVTDTFWAGSEEQALAYDLGVGHARWTPVMERLYNYYVGSNNLEQAKKVAEAEALECPSEPGYFERAANVCGKLNDLEQAAFYFRKAFALAPSFERARILFVLYLDLDRPVDALPYIDYAISLGKDSRLGIVKLNTEKIIGLEQAFGKDTLNTVLLGRIVDEYHGMGNRAGALKCLQIRGRASPGQTARDISLKLIPRSPKEE